MATLLDVKTDVAQQLGQTNPTSAVALRDVAINSARRTYYSEQQYSFLEKSADITISSQVGTIPTDMNIKFPFKKIYAYISGIYYEFSPVPWNELDSYDSSAYVYAIDPGNRQIKINQTTITTISCIYTYLPADKALDTSDNTDVEPAPDITPIVYLAVARYWLASERATGKYQLFKDLYDAEVMKARADSDLSTPKQDLDTINMHELGYNKPGYGLPKNTGYKK